VVKSCQEWWATHNGLALLQDRKKGGLRGRAGSLFHGRRNGKSSVDMKGKREGMEVMAEHVGKAALEAVFPKDH